MEFHTRAHSFYRDGGDDDSHRKYGRSNPPSRNSVRRGRGLHYRRHRLQDRSVGFSLRHGVFTLGLAGSRDPALPRPDLDRGGNWGTEPPSAGICERLACSPPAPVATLGNRRLSHQYHYGHSLFCRHALLLCLESAFSSEDGKHRRSGRDSGYFYLYLRFPPLGDTRTGGRFTCNREVYCSKFVNPLVGDHRSGPLPSIDSGISEGWAVTLSV